MSNFKMTPIIGLPRFDGWAQAISNPSQSLSVVFSIHGKNANSVGKIIAEELSSLEVNSPTELHSTMLDIIGTVREHDCHLQIAASYIENNSVIFMTQSGNVLLKRNGKVGNLVVSNGKLKVIQGKVNKNDLIILATHQSSPLIENIKRSLVKNNDLDLTITEAVSALHQWDDSSLSSLAFLQPNIEQSEKEPIFTKVENFKTENSNKISDKLQIEPTEKKALLKKLNFKAPNFGKIVGKIKKLFRPIKKRGLKSLRGLKSAGSRLKSIKNPFSKKPSLEDLQERKIKQGMIIGGAIITVLLITVGWKQWLVYQELSVLKKELNPLIEKVEAAQNLIESSPFEARVQTQEALQEMNNLVEKYQGEKASLAELRKEIIAAQSLAEKVSGKEEQSKLEPFFDLRLTELGFVAQDSHLVDNNLFALDKEKKQVVVLNIESKETSTISVESSGGDTVAIAANQRSLLSLGNGIHSFSIKEEKHTELKEQGESDGNSTLFTRFGSYLYVFNPEKRNIYRYILKSDELSDPIGWLTDKRDLDFTAVNNMVIDGDIWLGTKDGKVLKYTQGKKQDFLISGLENDFSGAIKIATKTDPDVIAVLESGRERVVFLNKEGLFIKEISSPSLAAAENILMDEEGKAIFVVSGSLIYKLDI